MFITPSLLHQCSVLCNLKALRREHLFFTSVQGKLGSLCAEFSSGGSQNGRKQLQILFTLWCDCFETFSQQGASPHLSTDVQRHPSSHPTHSYLCQVSGDKCVDTVFFLQHFLICIFYLVISFLLFVNNSYWFPETITFMHFWKEEPVNAADLDRLLVLQKWLMGTDSLSCPLSSIL